MHEKNATQVYQILKIRRAAPEGTWVKTTLGKANRNLNPERNKRERIHSIMSKDTTTNSQSKLEADRISSFNKVFEEPSLQEKQKR